MTVSEIRRVQVIDSHTGGEPTRVVVAGGPDLGDGPLEARLDRFRTGYDRFRSAVVNEPRGSDVMVGALLLEPVDPACAAAVIFFNNAGALGMCGHGTIGLVKTLLYLGRIAPGEHRIETPVGIVTARLYDSGKVSVRNVAAYRFAKDVAIEVPGIGRVVGDVAWGGNWFYLVRDHGQELQLDRVEELTDYTWHIRQALGRQGVTGRNGQEIDHIELFAPSSTPAAHSRNFVLCPGKAYDRSPCGTGTSAKLACLYADGKLAEGEIWRQESITGSVFEGSIERDGDLLIPTIEGEAWVNAEATLLLDPDDPLCWGMRCT
jgi:4-hydroxyproline epimerase